MCNGTVVLLVSSETAYLFVFVCETCSKYNPVDVISLLCAVKSAAVVAVKFTELPFKQPFAAVPNKLMEHNCLFT